MTREREVGRREQLWDRQRAEGRAKPADDQKRLACRVSAERARLRVPLIHPPGPISRSKRFGQVGRLPGPSVTTRDLAIARF